MYEKWKKKSHKEIGGEAAEDDHSFGPSRSASSDFSSESKAEKYSSGRKRGKGIVAAGGRYLI
jgi:hypothetical protein